MQFFLLDIILCASLIIEKNYYYNNSVKKVTKWHLDDLVPFALCRVSLLLVPFIFCFINH